MSLPVGDENPLSSKDFFFYLDSIKQSFTSSNELLANSVKADVTSVISTLNSKQQEIVDDLQATKQRLANIEEEGSQTRL